MLFEIEEKCRADSVIYYTADQHFVHSNIIRFCERPFTSVEEMDEALINNWNETVSYNDTVYILGDLIFRSNKHSTYYIDRLKGMKHLILGNHDHKWIKNCKTCTMSLSYAIVGWSGKRNIIDLGNVGGHAPSELAYRIGLLART